MPSDLQVTNIKANDGTAGLVIADSSGQVTGTLGSATVFPAHHIIQIIQATNTTQKIVTGTWEATSFSVTITPSATSSKILIMAGIQLMTRRSSSADAGDAEGKCKIYSNGAAGGDGSGTFAGVSNEQKLRGYDYGTTGASPDGLLLNTVLAVNWLDSPSLDVPIIYKIYVKHQTGEDTRFNDGGGSTMTLMEVAG